MSTPPRPRFHPDPEAPQLGESGLRGRDGDYLPDPGLVAAANVALALELPLLLTGEPGSGKTDFAFVVANALAESDPDPAATLDPDEDSGAQPGARPAAGRDALLECYIRSDSRARDLLYDYDALLRFGDGQHGGPDGHRRAVDARHYIELQALGVALVSARRRVVLIDEIDKAPRDLPNDLLRELDRGEFEIPEIRTNPDAGVVRDRFGVALSRVMRRPAGAPKPVVIITSNVERQLPDPFLRRCVFYHIPFPDRDRLLAILARRFPEHEPAYLTKLVRVFEAARSVPDLIKKPSTAELLHWTAALTRAFEPGEAAVSVAGFERSLDDRGRTTRPELGWADLPGVGCLFKLNEDIEAARRHAAVAR